MRDGDDGAIVVIVGNRSTVQPGVQRRADFRRCHEQPQRQRQNSRREEDSFARSAIEMALSVSQIVCNIAGAGPDASGFAFLIVAIRNAYRPDAATSRWG
jgi:hypothetical protein